MRYSLLLYMALLNHGAYALGNHPESSNCPSEKSYYAICTHALHNLEGWYGECQATAQAAQIDADKHSNAFHHNNSRWTGIKKVR